MKTAATTPDKGDAAQCAAESCGSQTVSAARCLSAAVGGLLFLCALAVFIPAFIFDFGFHNDYGLLFRCPDYWAFQFRESRHLFLVGRPLNGLLMSAQTCLATRIHHLAAHRFACFLLLAAAAGLFYRYCRRRLPLSAWWAVCWPFACSSCRPATFS